MAELARPASIHPPVVVQVLGPTGAGKSRLAIRLAREFGGEIISADSMQVYRGFDIGTDKLLPPDRQGIPHHLIDVVTDCSQFNAARFLEAAVVAVDEIRRRGRLPLVCGGTALYLRTMIRGIFPEAPRRRVERRILRRLVERQGVDRLWRRLQAVDPVYGASVGPRDTIRVIRAMEIYYNHGRPPSEVFRDTRTPFAGFRFIRIGISPEREELYRRIDSRVERMLERGLVEEVRRLRRQLPAECPPFKALGYREVGEYLDKKKDWEKTVEEIKRHSRQFAKRQLSWFRQEKDIQWFDPEAPAAVREWLRLRLQAEEHG